MRIPRSVDLSSPVLAFALVWTATLLLFHAQLSYPLTSLRLTTVLMVLANIGTFAVIYLSLRFGVPHPTPIGLETVKLRLPRLRRLVWMILVMWAAGSALEVIAARGIPVLWRLLGIQELNYGDFGLPTFHGLMNALYLFTLSALYLDFYLTRKRRHLVTIAFLLLWPVLIISRGLLAWALVQLAGMYVILQRVRLRQMLRLAVVLVVFVLVFGAVGDFRIGVWQRDGQTGPVSGASGVLARLPSGFAWIYAYVTSSLNNVNASIDDLAPTYSVYYSTVNLFPTIIRRELYDQEAGKYPLPLVVDAYNTSTVYGNFLADFGVAGAATAMTAIQLFVVFIYLAARRRALWALLAYPVLFQAIILSVVTDTFTSLVNIFQLALSIYVGVTIRQPSRLRPARVQPSAERGILPTSR